MNQKNHVKIFAVFIVVILAGVMGYSVLEQNSTISIHQPSPAVENTVNFSRHIACNPRGYDPEYFKQEKPCVSDMTALGRERENKAFSIIKQAITDTPSAEYKYGSSSQLFISDKRYQLIKVNVAPFFGYIVADTVGEKVTDYFVPHRFVTESPERWVFSDGFIVGQYVFGREKSTTFPESKVYDPQTYYQYVTLDGYPMYPYFNVLDSNSDSLTLGVYDSSKPLTQKLGDDFIEFKQVGTKIIKLEN
ncbi:MAG: hypothetical protein HYT94_00295 [Parcubacteria group bacterium]|nr:hypothetical protein [Parcubacteria group bacterium]